MNADSDNVSHDTPQYGERLPVNAHSWSSETPPPLIPLAVVEEKSKWARWGIIAGGVYGVYCLILMLVIEPITSSGLNLFEAYRAISDAGTKVGYLQAIVFMFGGVGVGVGLRSFVMDRDTFTAYHVKLTYLIFLALGGPFFLASAVGTTVALSHAFGHFGPTSGAFYVFPYLVSTVAACAAVVLFAMQQARVAKRDDESL